jgi:hypothetical protein
MMNAAITLRTPADEPEGDYSVNGPSVQGLSRLEPTGAFFGSAEGVCPREPARAVDLPPSSQR